MKIIDLDDPLKRIVEVYAIYWVNEVRHHLVMPYDGYDSFIVITEDRCKIINPEISRFILRKSGSGRDILVHWAAEKGDLLDRLTDGQDSEAVAELHRRIREDKPSI